jgi:hypothetical protein
MRKEPRRVANKPRVERTQRLEGSQTSPHRLDSGRLRRASRFRPYRLKRHEFNKWRTPRPESSTTGGSRGRLEVWQFYGPVVSAAHGIDAMGKTLRWVIPGSRLLLTDRTAIL